MSESRPQKQLGRLSVPRFCLGIGLSLLALYLAVRDIRWTEVTAALSTADRLGLLLVLGSVLLNTWMKALRWRLLFYPSHSQLPIARCLSAMLVGQLANKLLPARMGDLARAYSLRESTSVSAIFALATIMVENAIDSVILLALVALLALGMPMPLWLARSSLLLSGILAGLLFALIVLANQREKIVRALQGQSQGRPSASLLRAVTRLVETTQTLGALRDPSVQARVWAWSLLIWVTAAATNALAFWALRLDVNIAASLLLLVVLMAGAVLPAAPLEIGVFDYLCVLTLSWSGVERSIALSFALVLHLAVYLPVVVGGVLGLWVGQLDLRKLDPRSTARDG